MQLDDKLKTRLKSRFWRLNNLYYITDKDGNRVKFKMTNEQLEYFENKHSRNIILKARQLGFTTEECIMQLDAAIFMNKRCAMIAHKLSDAMRLFREKIKYAYENLPEIIRLANPLENLTKEEIVFIKGGSVSISTSFRGGTLYSLHVSEFGKICAKYPDKAREIVTGAFESVGLGGTITLESTAEGRSGYFFDYCQSAEKLKIQCRDLNILDWKFFFFSWWQNPKYAIESSDEIPQRLVGYFEELEDKYGIKTTKQQQHWYASKEKTLGEDVKREYPSISSEAFAQSVEGAYYAKQFKKIYADGRICKLPENDHALVCTAWDIGVGDSTVIWFFKIIGDQIHIIDYYENSGEGLRHYMGVLKSKGYSYDKSGHYAPHDIMNKEFGSDAKSRFDLAREGYEIDGQRYSISFQVLPRGGIDDGIEQVRELLPKCVFDEYKCEEGISHLENYRKEWDDKRGCWKDKPLHDHTSHAADAFRYLANSQTKRKIAKTTKLSMRRQFVI